MQTEQFLLTRKGNLIRFSLGPLRPSQTGSVADNGFSLAPPTSRRIRSARSAPRGCIQASPFEEVWPLIEQWLNEQPDATAKALFQRLQAQTPTPFAPGQLRTLQRRVKEWRTAMARRLVLGAGDGAEALADGYNSEPGG